MNVHIFLSDRLNRKSEYFNANFPLKGTLHVATYVIPFSPQEPVHMDQKKTTVTILILGLLTAIGPFSIDMYLPGFPAIAKDLHTDISHVGWSLTSFFLGISIGQLIYGPVLDRFGRKPPVLFGLALYALAAIGCMFAPDVEWLVGWRFILALGGCAGMVASRAVVQDLFPANESARVFSILMLVMGLAPIVAPTLGGGIVSDWGWRAIFGLLIGISTLLFLLVFFLLEESKGPDNTVSLRPINVMAKYSQVIKNPDLAAYSFASGISMAGMFAYISGSPYVYMDLFGLTAKQYGWAFGVNAFGFIAGTQLNRLWLNKRGAAHITLVSSTAMFILSVLLMAGAYLGTIHKVGVLILLFLCLFCLGFINPNTTALALAPFKKAAGSASALNGFIRMILGAFSSGLVSYLANGTALPMVGIIALCSTLGFVIVVLRQYVWTGTGSLEAL